MSNPNTLDVKTTPEDCKNMDAARIKIIETIVGLRHVDGMCVLASVAGAVICDSPPDLTADKIKIFLEMLLLAINGKPVSVDVYVLKKDKDALHS